jgi:Spy/CpxP family protein refolding chaperone
MRMKSLLIISILAAALQIAPIAYTQGGGGRQRGGGAGGGGGQMGNLTPEERQKVMNARKSAMQDPSVSSARQKLQAAQKEFHEALDAAMLKADPSLKPILDKMPKGHEGGRQRGGGGEPE